MFLISEGCHILSVLQIKQTQDEEKKQLTALRDLIKSSLQLDQKEVNGPSDALLYGRGPSVLCYHAEVDFAGC